MNERSGNGRENGCDRVWLSAVALSPLAAYLYPAIGGFLATSEVPLVLGRYSKFLAVMNLWDIGIYALALWSFHYSYDSIRQLCYLLVIASSLLVPGNNDLQQLPLIAVALPSIRLLAAVAVIVSQFRHFRQTKNDVHELYLGIGTLVILISLADFGLLFWTRAIPPHAISNISQFRQNYNLRNISSNDIVLIGDSFVWGQGVRQEEAFGNVLQRLYTAGGNHKQVYSLGIVGGDVKTYIRTVSLMPEGTKADRIILSYYSNDMPGRPRPQDLLHNQAIALGVGCPTLRVIGDAVAKLFTPTVEEYFAQIVDDYRKDEPSFGKRWALLRDDLQRFRSLAAHRSDKPPLFLIIPIMVDFQDYPLVNTHKELSNLSETLGYQALDLFPIFRDALGDGRKYRASPNDNHFDLAVHELVAHAIKHYLHHSGSQ